MSKLHLLGTGAALSDKYRTTTMLALEAGDSLVVIDCGGDAAQRLLASELDLQRVTGLIVTHEHADHVGGFPLLMERLWLAGHRDSFDVYGLPTALAQLRRLQAAFDVSDWPNYPSLIYHPVDATEHALVLDNDDLEVHSSPGKHAVPVIGVRVRSKRSGGVATYSADTERSAAITRLAANADLLVHEATGPFPGHSSAADAAGVAAEAGAKRLVLVHLPALPDGGREVVAEAQTVFAATELGRDGVSYELRSGSSHTRLAEPLHQSGSPTR